MAKLIFSTGNIVLGGPSIVRKPGANRSNLELINSLRSNFVVAQQDFAAEAALNGNSNTDDSEAGSITPSSHGDDETGRPMRRPPLSVWTESDGPALFVPRIDWALSGLQEERSQYEITVKLFFLASAPVSARPLYAAEAVDLVLRELRVTSIDLLILSFPGMSFDGDCEWKADKLNATQGNDDDEAATWAALEPVQRSGLVRNLGIAEFGSEKLARLLKRVAVRPRVDQINIKNCCNVPPPLVKLATEQRIELLVHTDCTDILPKGTLRELLGQGVGGAGVLADTQSGKDSTGLRGDLTPQWVVKYTAVVRDRGVIENKGYFAAAELAEET